jgi:hypothetical protein
MLTGQTTLKQDDQCLDTYFRLADAQEPHTTVDRRNFVLGETTPSFSLWKPTQLLTKISFLHGETTPLVQFVETHTTVDDRPC